MAYTKHTWVNGSAPAISADHLNEMETGIYNNDQRLDTLSTPPVLVRFFTVPSYTYAADAAHWVYGDNLQAPTVAGYTPVGVLQATPESGGAGLVIQIVINYESFGSRFAGLVRNVTSSAITQSFKIPVLYIRDDLYSA